MTTNDIYTHCWLAVLVVGIPGNILVIALILRQKGLLKSNYYFLVLQLAMCDIAVLIFYLLDGIRSRFGYFFPKWCFGFRIIYLFRYGGVAMMLVISMLRYRATIHPLKPAIRRRTLRVVCVLVYLLGIILGVGPAMPLCIPNWKHLYENIDISYVVLCYYFFPTLSMAFIYYKICRKLKEQKNDLKIASSCAVRQNVVTSSSNIITFIRNRRTTIVCLGTVLSYGIANIPASVGIVWLATDRIYSSDVSGSLVKSSWFMPFAYFFRIACTHSLNPLIYGTLDKKLFTFRKFCFKRKWKSR